MLAYIFLRIIAESFRLLPFSLLYVFSDGLAFLLYRVVGYRKKVIYENLQRAFPEKSEAEIRKIVRDTYRNLTDVTLETIKSHTSSLDEINRRCKVLNPEIVSAYQDKGSSVLLAASHNCNWEYGGLTIPAGLRDRLYGVYKPLTNKVIGDYIAQRRARGGLVLIPMDDAVGIMRKQKDVEAWAYMLISDQSPSSRKRAQWVTFFGQKTATLPGIDVLARLFNFPVFRYEIRRVRRGYYEVEYEPLWLEPATAQEGDITQAYTKRLEAEIRANPGNWLWSHKRWKMKPED
jgi:Kdo2-lipid IVA lauroyltransferase/acyltransferase